MVETVRTSARRRGTSHPGGRGGPCPTGYRLRIAPELRWSGGLRPGCMSALALANTIQDADERQNLVSDIEAETDELLSAAQTRERSEGAEGSANVAPAQVSHTDNIPNPPDLRLHVISDYDLSEIFPYINPQMLYVRHLGYKGRFAEALEREESDALELRDQVRKVEDIMLAHPGIRASAVFKFFPCHSDGQTLQIYAPDGETVLESFYFGRQSQREGLCLSDYARPAGSGPPDYVAMFTTTVGPAVRALSDEMRENGEFLNSHILQVLALESAEAFAELLHKQIRQMWGIGDPAGLTFQDLFRTQYHGRRFSFGYPACPRLEDQEQLFRLLDVTSNIGVELTEGFMMDPEGSVSALVFHHPEARYFNLSEQDIDRLEAEVEAKGL